MGQREYLSRRLQDLLNVLKEMLRQTLLISRMVGGSEFEFVNVSSCLADGESGVELELAYLLLSLPDEGSLACLLNKASVPINEE